MLAFRISIAFLCSSYLGIINGSTSNIVMPDEEHKIWGEGVAINSPRSNIYNLPDEQLQKAIKSGRQYFFEYPVDITGATIPLKLFDYVYKEKPWHPLSIVFRSVLSLTTGKSGEDAVYQYLGLSKLTYANNYLDLPFPQNPRTNNYLGASIISTAHGDGLTFSCAACHVQTMFGKPVLGLANRFPTANEFLLRGKNLIDTVSPSAFGLFMGGDRNAIEQLKRLKKNMAFVEGKQPIAPSLDTSLAQVGLSLAIRKPDEFATRDEYYLQNPRDRWLERFPADSKPMPWWNLKYKNKWLSDGSVVSGNPIFTNLIWNEMGRGSSMRKLQSWIENNPQIIRDMTAAVFATESPRYEFFFNYKRISIEKAKRGKAVFESNCAGCHGTYSKGWETPDVQSEFDSDLNYVNNELYKKAIQTTNVNYHADTPVIDVGTDPYRVQGMYDFAKDLNRLELSKVNNVIVKGQDGYVPPPMVGIWARYPYMHNNSIPNLCILLTPEHKRPKTYWAGEAINQEKDFDHDCVGYPMGRKVPRKWKRDRKKFFDTKKRGLSNQGHSDGILVVNGKEVLSKADKADLIEYLKTL